MSVELTSGFGNGSDHNGWYGHGQTSKGGHIGQQLSSTGRFAGQDTLEIYLRKEIAGWFFRREAICSAWTDLPRNAAKYQQQTVIYVVPMFFGLNLSYPIDFHRGQTLDMVIGPGKRNAHPEANENAKQLNDIGVGDRIESTEQRVEDSNAGREYDGCAMVHVDDDGQCCSWRCKEHSLE